MKRLATALLLLSCGCAAPPQGVSFGRLSELEGACPVQPDSSTPHPDVPRDLEYRRVKGVAAFQGGSRWDGGHALVIAWQDEDGTVSRVFVDVGPEHGYLASYFDPATSDVARQQGLGFVSWKNGVRTFEARSALAVVQYVYDQKSEELFSAAPLAPGTLFLHAAFDGVDHEGRPLCRVLGLHASAVHERQKPYDPSWLTPSPTALILHAAGETLAPDFSQERAPTAVLVDPGEAPPDPGGDPPRLDATGPMLFDAPGGGENPCD